MGDIDIDKQIKSGTSFKEIFKETTAEWAKSSTSHGIPNIARSKYGIIKFMWTLCFLGSLGYCSYTLIKSLIDFFNYDTVIQMTIGTESPVEFPAVTICNLNTFYQDSTSDAQYFDNILYNYNYTFALNLTNADNLTYYLDTSDTTQVIDDILTVMKNAISSNKSYTDDDRKQFGFALDKYMLISCTYNGIQCSEANFSWFWSYDYGNCYTFNNGHNSLNQSLPILGISKSGSSYGLKMELLVGNPSLLEYSYESGMYVLVHNKSDNVKALGLAGGITVQTGVETFVSVSRIIRNKLSKPYSDCLSDWIPFSSYSTKLFNIITSLNLTLKYDQQLCYKICMQEYAINNCTCMFPNLPSISDVPYCTNKTQLNCSDYVNELFATSNNDDLCLSSCPQQCVSVVYKLSSYTATYPTTKYVSLLKTKSDLLSVFDLNNPTMFSYLKESILKINVNYNDLSYEIINEIPAMNIETLLGTLGGQLGLFIGISFLSMIEILELIIEFVIIFHKIRKQRAKVAFS